jgi:excisionase family DNA binding protein
MLIVVNSYRLVKLCFQFDFRERSGYSGTVKETFLTVREAADYLRISRQTLSKLRTGAGLPFIRVGRKVLFRVSDLDGFMESRVVRPKPAKKRAQHR